MKDNPLSGEQRSFKRLIDIGIALSSEKDSDRLMELILLEAKNICRADGGTLYIRSKIDELAFTIVRTDSLKIAQGGTTGEAISLPPVKMFKATGEPNLDTIVAYVAHTGKTLNIENAYEADGFDVSGTKKFDLATGYRSRSFLTVPLKNNSGYVIGVLQLLNALDPETGEVGVFPEAVQPLVEALSSQAAISLENQILMDSQKHLLDSFIELMASAVDAKSRYTGGHCQRVPELTKMLARAACDSVEPVFSDFDLDEAQWYELHIGAWLHDCGKVTTPEYVVDKATKLETITDRIHEIRMRFEVAKCEAVIAHQQKIIDGEIVSTSALELELRLQQLDEDFAFIAKSNLGAEFMADADVARIERIAEQEWTRTLDDRIGISFEEARRKALKPLSQLPVTEKILADRPDHIIDKVETSLDATQNTHLGFKMIEPLNKYNHGEVYNLSIRRGTLTEEERFKINEHIVQTIVMLENLPFPKHLENVPEIAGGHHEKMDGSGYPKQLKGHEMSVPARIMAIADVFEALTAADRPYKKAKTLNESLKIMSHMVREQHLDADLFRLFLSSGVYQTYADDYLLPEQLEDIEVSDYL